VNDIRRILVAVKNPAAKTLPAVLKAAQLAKAFGAELILFQSIDLPIFVDGDVSYMNDGLADFERCTGEACEKALEVIAGTLRRKGIKVSVSAQFDYPIYEAVIREAKRLKADLIVAEQHRGHRAASLLHLVDWELLRLSPVPVLLVKDPHGYRRPKILAAVDPDHTYAKPVWLDREILNAGQDIAKAFHGTLHAVHAYPPIPVLAFPTGAITKEGVEAVYARSAKDANKKLNRALRDAEMRNVVSHVIGRHPSDAIAEVAGKIHSSLVVMGAISRSGFKRLLIGNTAERVLDRLSCDVLVIKPAYLIKSIPQKRRGAVHARLPPRSLII
jgi:universal stress protein E